MLDDLYIHMKTIDDTVEMGKMMSCDGLTYKGKVFCFYYKDKMVFKLGKDYDIQSHGVESFTYLNPFKEKGPMKAWYELTMEYKSLFPDLAEIALGVIKHG